MSIHRQPVLQTDRVIGRGGIEPTEWDKKQDPTWSISWGRSGGQYASALPIWSFIMYI